MLGIKTGLDITSVNKTKQEFTKLLTDMQNTANRNPIRINIRNTTSQINSINNSMRTLGSSANNTSNSFKGLGSSLGSLTGFYARWLSVSSAVNLALSETRKAIGFAFEQDERVRNVSMISGEDRKTVQGYTQDWLNLGLELKQSTSIISESNEEWLRAGANLSEINELTKMTVKTSEVAGSKIADTTSQAIALKNAYSMTNNELEGVLESVVKMDNTSSTGTDKLLRSLLVVAPSAKQAKAPIEWLVAGLTTVQSKSKQTAESVGKNFRNIFLNMTKMTNGEDQIGLNKAEDQLNKINIAMRSSSNTFRSADKILDDLGKTWNTLSEVQQAELSMSLAGKENSNSFNILMQNQAETLKNLNNIKQAGGSLDKAYEEHLISANGALGELKASLEQVYTQMINGDGLKNVLNDLTKIVHFVGFLITDGKELTKVWIGLLIAIKNFKLLEVGIMGCVTAFKYLKVFGLEALTLLSFNPIILSITALIAILATVTYSQYKHSKQVKELKQEYDLLNKSMSEMNGDEIEKNTTKLKEQQIELDKLAKSAGFKMDMGFGVTDDSGQRNLDKFIKTLEEGGFTVDKAKNKILELSQAESNIATSDTLTAIQNKTNATIEESSETQGLISEYMNLSQQENLSAEKKKLLSGLTQQLVGKIGGLKTSTDEHGNSVITNTGYLGTQIDVLELLKQQSIITANAQIDGAINTSSAIHNGTIQTLEDMKSAILGQQALSQALASTNAGKTGFFDIEQTAIGMGIKNLENSVAKIESLKSKFNMKAPTLSGITSKSPSGYTPSATDGSSNVKDKADIANLETKTDRYYKLNSALQSVEVELDRLNKLESNATESEKLKLKEQEIKLLDQKKIAMQNIYRELSKENQLNADNLKKQGAKFDNLGNIVNKNELISSKSANSNKLTGDAKKLSQENFKKFEDSIKEYESIRFDKINEISAKIFNLEQDRLNVIKDTQEIVKSKIESLLNEEKQVAELKLSNTRDSKIAKYDEELKEFKKTHNAIIDGIDDEIKATEDLTKAKEESEEKTKRQIELSKLQSKLNNLYVLQAKELELYNNKTKEQFEENIKIKNDALQSQIDNINKVNKAEEEKETRLKNQNDLIKLQTELQNTQEQKNVRQLVKKDDGSFNFEYVADQSKIEEINQQIIEKQKSNADWEKQIADNKHIAILQAQIEANNKTVEENSKTLSLLEKQLNGTVDGILGQINDLNTQIIDKQKDNNKWELSLIESKNRERLEKEKKAQQELITAEEKSINDKKIITENAYKAESFLLTQHYADMDKLVVVEMDKLKVTYGSKWSEILREVNANLGTMRAKNNEMMALQNSLSMGVTTGGGSSSGKYNVTVIDSQGNSQTKTMSSSEYNSPAIQNELNGIRNIDGTVVRVVGMDTGGMTTDWNDGDSGNGKLVKLHPNEIVSNPLDTSKLLRASEFVSKVDLNSISENITSFSFSRMRDMQNIPNLNNIPQISNNKSEVTHQYTFSGDMSFPNVTNEHGAESLIKGLKGITSQYANKPK